MSPLLSEHAEEVTQMFGMGEGLKLARAGGEPFTEFRIFFLHPDRDVGEKLCLGDQAFRSQSNGLARRDERGEIHMGGEVLFAGPCQEIADWMMLVIGAQGPLSTFGREKLVRG